MNVTIKLDKRFDPKEVMETLTTVVSEKTSFAEYKVQHYKETCKNFENKHKLKSGEFLRKFESGDMGDKAEYFDWFAAKRGLDIWMHKLNILKGVSIGEA